jgi:hypothetical protein
MDIERLQIGLEQTIETLPFRQLAEAAGHLQEAQQILGQVLAGSANPDTDALLGLHADAYQQITEHTGQLRAVESLLQGYIQGVGANTAADASLPQPKSRTQPAPPATRTNPRPQLTEQQSQVITEITDAATSLADQQFGSGFPDFTEVGHTALRYHNGYHARSVSDGSVKMGEKLGLSKADLAIAAVAGAAHDVVQDKGSGQNETESAAWLAEKLRRDGIFPEDAVLIGNIAILGTEPTFEDGVLTGQKASELEYPSKRAEHIAKSVASADLGKLYTPEGPRLTHELYREIKGQNRNETPEIDESLVAFQRNSALLVSGYQYPLAEANTVLATHRPQVVAYHEKTLEQLEHGEIHSWQQLIEQDDAFRRRNS